MRLSQRAQGYEIGRYIQPTIIPMAAVCEPKLLLIDEGSGSDGDLIGHSFRAMGLGKVVGKRSWGGLMSQSEGYGTIDGGEIGVACYTVAMLDGARSVESPVENVGVVPDVEVDLSPTDVLRGRDGQLERAVAQLMTSVEAAACAAEAAGAAGAAGAVGVAALRRLWQVRAGDAQEEGGEEAGEGEEWPFALPADEDEEEEEEDAPRNSKGGTARPGFWRGAAGRAASSRARGSR